jgi:hypothetical protein
VLEVLLALLASLLFAVAIVLQQREAARGSREEALRAGFLLRLARRPVWLAGIAVDALGFVAQAAALGVGRLVVVQPLLADVAGPDRQRGARRDGLRRAHAERRRRGDRLGARARRGVRGDRGPGRGAERGDGMMENPRP